MKRSIIAIALLAVAQTQAQTITSSGLGIAGNGKTATTQPYNIGIVASGNNNSVSSDGTVSSTGTVYITINGNFWPVFAPSAYSSAFCHIVKWDSVQMNWVKYGFIKATTPDGTAFLAGTIFIKTIPDLKVVSFKGIAFYTPKTMPPVTENQIIVYRYQPICGCYIQDPNLTIHTPLVGGAIWVNHDGDQILSGVLDGFGTVSIIPVPPPSGGAQSLPIYPAKMF